MDYISSPEAQSELTCGPATRALEELKASLSHSKNESPEKDFLISHSRRSRTTMSYDGNTLNMTALLSSIKNIEVCSFPTIEWEFHDEQKYGYDYADATFVGHDSSSRGNEENKVRRIRKDHILSSLHQSKKIDSWNYDTFSYADLEGLDRGSILSQA